MNQKQLFFPAVLLAAILLLSNGCDKPEPIPAYITIKPFIVNAQGGNDWHKVTEGWLYVNGNLLGGFTLPATVPVLEEGTAEVIILPGVRVNGLKDSPGFYPFMKRYETTVTFAAMETVTVQPLTSYEPETKFAWPEDLTTFDGPASISLQNRDLDEDNTFEVSTEGGFQGKGLLLKVNTDHPTLEISTEKLEIPNQGANQVWLEMHYKTDIPFSFQLVGIDNGGIEQAVPVFLFNATENGEWNKIYFNLTDYVVGLSKDYTGLFFRVPLPVDQNNKFSVSEGTVKLDNIRLLYF